MDSGKVSGTDMSELWISSSDIFVQFSQGKGPKKDGVWKTLFSQRAGLSEKDGYDISTQIHMSTWTATVLFLRLGKRFMKATRHSLP